MSFLITQEALRAPCSSKIRLGCHPVLSLHINPEPLQTPKKSK